MCTAHNPLPDHEIRQKAAACTPARKDCPQFATVGRLAVEKGFDRLIDAVARLHREGEQLQVHIVGDGGLQEELSARIRSHDLEDVVILEGFHSNPHPYIAAADWYVCSSLDEAFSLTVGEAFILGRPVLGTDCSGIREWLGDSRYGIVTENSTAGIYEGLKRILHMTPDEQAYWLDQTSKKAAQIGFQEALARWAAIVLGK